MTGRSTLMTPQLVAQLEATLMSGATIKDTCQYVRVGESTFHEWMEIGNAVIEGKAHRRKPKDEAERQRFAEFAERMKKAQSAMRINAVATINEHAEKTWQAAAWLLERSDPEHWAQHSHLRIEGMDELIEAARANGVSLTSLIKALVQEMNSGSSESE